MSKNNRITLQLHLSLLLRKANRWFFHFRFKSRKDCFLFCSTGILDEGSDSGSPPAINQLWSYCCLNPGKGEGGEPGKLSLEKAYCNPGNFQGPVYSKNTLPFCIEWWVLRKRCLEVLLHSSATRLYNNSSCIRGRLTTHFSTFTVLT